MEAGQIRGLAILAGVLVVAGIFGRSSNTPSSPASNPPVIETHSAVDPPSAAVAPVPQKTQPPGLIPPVPKPSPSAQKVVGKGLSLDRAVAACKVPLRKHFHTDVGEVNVETDFDSTGVHGNKFFWNTAQFQCIVYSSGRVILTVPTNALALVNPDDPGPPKSFSEATAPPPADSTPLDTSADASSSSASSPVPSSIGISYAVDSTCPTDVTYISDGGGTEQEGGVPSGWSKEVSPGDFASISAQLQCEDGDVTVSILNDGQVVKEATSQGSYSIASANYP